MIAVDTKALAGVLGLEKWPEEFHNDHQRMAARCITDFVRLDSSSVSAYASIANATHWIDMAYDAGLNAGIALERRRWQEKLAELFDIPVAR